MENPLLQKKNWFQSNTNYNKLVKAVSKGTAFFFMLNRKYKKYKAFLNVMHYLSLFYVFDFLVFIYAAHNLESLFFRFD